LLIVSNKTLRILAAIVWYIGSIVLFIKGSSLLIEAKHINISLNWHLIAFVIALVIGMIKTKYIFIKACKKNIDRINNLVNPKVWQFYRTGFFILLIIMIITGAILSNLVHGKYIMLILVGSLDISISTALLGSSYIFWK
jgi:hypothetical protein